MSSHVDPNSVPGQSFEWGLIKWFVTPDRTEGSGLTFGEVVLLPGKGHDRHNHPDSEEILYVLSGEGKQMVNDEEPFPVRTGDTIHIPKAVFHSTVNTSWAPMHLLALYSPGGAEKALERRAAGLQGDPRRRDPGTHPPLTGEPSPCAPPTHRSSPNCAGTSPRRTLKRTRTERRSWERWQLAVEQDRGTTASTHSRCRPPSKQGATWVIYPTS
jgi:quercetin dioxygenase-like cupin family protein